jgi:hypothetical protein
MINPLVSNFCFAKALFPGGFHEVKKKGLRESGSLCFKILGDLRQMPGSMLESAPPTTVESCICYEIHHIPKISIQIAHGKG